MLHSSLRRVPLCLAAAAVTLLAVTSVASATHVRPKGATPIYDSLVISYKQCSSAAGGAFHAPPFSVASCNPPGPTSPFLTAGEPTSNARPANFIGSSQLKVVPGDVQATLALQGVMCTPVMAGAVPAACPSGAFEGYVGNVSVQYILRITDHCNATGGPPAACPTPPGVPATTADVPLRAITPPCAFSGPGIGSTCNVTTTFNSIAAGAVVAGMRANTHVEDVGVYDGGPDANAATPTNERYAEEGVFTP
jgi:hypothetical protein